MNKEKRDEILHLLKKTGCSDEVVVHCKAVAELAFSIAEQIPSCDSETAYIGGLVHDIGRSVTHLIEHGVEGGRIAEEYGLDLIQIRIIENHIGAGLSAVEAESLNLPARDFIPLSIEEKVVAHADNLFSGTNRRTLAKLVKKLGGKGHYEAIERVKALHKELCLLADTDIEKL